MTSVESAAEDAKPQECTEHKEQEPALLFRTTREVPQRLAERNAGQDVRSPWCPRVRTLVQERREPWKKRQSGNGHRHEHPARGVTTGSTYREHEQKRGRDKQEIQGPVLRVDEQRDDKAEHCKPGQSRCLERALERKHPARDE